MKDVIACINFEEKDFYVTPPPDGAPVEIWEAWSKADKVARTAAKAAHTRAINVLADESDETVDFSPEAPAAMVRKGPGGKYTQGTAFGFAGDAEGDGCTIEPAIDPQQEKLIALHRMAQQAGKGSRGDQRGRQAKRRARKARKKALKGR